MVEWAQNRSARPSWARGDPPDLAAANGGPAERGFNGAFTISKVSCQRTSPLFRSSPRKRSENPTRGLFSGCRRDGSPGNETSPFSMWHGVYRYLSCAVVERETTGRRTCAFSSRRTKGSRHGTEDVLTGFHGKHGRIAGFMTRCCGYPSLRPDSVRFARERPCFLFWHPQDVLIASRSFQSSGRRGQTACVPLQDGSGLDEKGVHPGTLPQSLPW